MTNIQKTIETKIYGYNPNEFLPVYRDGVLDNRTEFIFYKMRSLVRTVIQ